MDALTDTWEIHNRINIYFITAIDEANFADTSSSKGRTVGEQLAHIHNVRLMWLNVAMPELMPTVKKIEKDSITKKLVLEQLDKSSKAISQLLSNASTTGKVKNFKPHPSAFLGYLVAHEAHHRAQVILSLKQSGHPLDKKILFGMWEWGNK